MKYPALLCTLLLGLSVVPATRLAGQVAPGPGSWRLEVNGEAEEWPLDPRLAADSLDSVVSSLIAYLQRQGRIEARLEAVAEDPDGSITLRVNGGPLYLVESLEIEGFTIPGVRKPVLGTRSGHVFDPQVFERDVEEMLHFLERRGYVIAEVQVSRFETRVEDGRGHIRLGLIVDPGERPTLAEIRLPGAGRTRVSYVSRQTGLGVGRPLTEFEAAQIRSRLVQTGDFARIGIPILLVEPDGRAVLVIPLEEAAPGSFDAVLGYLPASGGSKRGSVVGNVDVTLRHLMGAGRRFRFQFNRMPARVSRLAIEGEDPFVGGLPIRLAGGFDGYQRDSTYSRQRMRAESGYRLGGNMEAFLSLTREATRPGTDSLIAIPSSNSWFVGIGFRVGRLDDPRNPSRGWTLSLSAERGTKVRSLLTGSGSVANPSLGEGLRQQRLFAVWRTYVPVVGRHVVVWGGETSVVISPTYDAADLYQLGGANSLRGYNEEQFEGNFAGRTLGEWRVRLEEDSFMFLFADLGLLGRPAATPGATGPGEDRDATWRLYPGYGVGMQFGTDAGNFTISLALNPSEGLGTKVHIGISLGL